MASSSLLRPSLGINNEPSTSTSSRTSSFYQTSRIGTPAGFPSSLTSSSQHLPLHPQESQQQQQQLHPHHHIGISSKLKHMFDNTKYALFEATVVIHELGNVPQLSGEFDVKWKFRGKSPRPKEMVELSKNGHNAHNPPSKPSLPNLKLSAQNMQPSSSAISIGTTSTTSSGAHPPTPRSLLNPSTIVNAGSSRPSKSLSLPPSRDEQERPTKKGSEPTPLKQMIKTDQNPDTPPSESPHQITDEPEAFEDDDNITHSRSTSTSSSSQPSVSSTKTGVPPMISIHRPSMASSSRPSRNSSGLATPTERLAVPFPRSVPIRGGTTPSYSTFIDPALEVNGESSKRGMNRTISMATTATSSSNSASTAMSNVSSRPFLSRSRSASGPSMKKFHGKHRNEEQSNRFSETRTGTTPTKTLRSHSAKWDYELHHIIRIPISKNLTSATTPTSANSLNNPYKARNNGPPLPVLGDGPLSESGLKLEIEQLPLHSGKSKSNHSTNDVDGSHSAITDGKDSTGNHMRKETRDKIPFGRVDVDLAAFAGRGHLTRRFLLKGTRTNATIKLSVDMKYIGGEDKWTVPPMQEGHHVSGVHDIMPETDSAMRSDLGLTKTPSNSSSGSSLGLDLQRTRTSYSTVSSNYQTRNHSMTELGRSVTNNSYQPYQNHLAPSASRLSNSPKKEPIPLSSNVPSGRQSPIKQSLPTIDTSNGLSRRLGPSIVNLSKAHDHHKHHTHHLRRHHHHRSSSHGISDLPAEVIIEAIFNPHPASVSGPFTYVPKDQLYNEFGNNNIALENEKQVLARVVKQASLDNGTNSDFNNSRSGSKTGSRGNNTGEHTPENVIDLNDDIHNEHNNDQSSMNESTNSGSKHKLPWRGMRVRAKAEREQKEREKQLQRDKNKDKEQRVRNRTVSSGY